MIRSIIIIAIA